MTTTTMHFGPEWMRTKQVPARPNPSPPLVSPTAGPAPAGVSSYSALVAPAPQTPSEKRDLANPFRYSKEDMLRIYKEGGGKGGLGLEVERWEGIVREVGSDPVSMKEMGEADRKLFAGPLNSEMRRRPSMDYLSLSATGLGDRPKLNHTNTGGNSPMRERIGGFMGRRRDSTDQPQLSLPRKLSQSSLQPPLASPRDALPSPRTRIGGAGGFDGVLSDSWSVRRRASEGLLKSSGRVGDASDAQTDTKAVGIKEEDEETRADGLGVAAATLDTLQANVALAAATQDHQRQLGQDSATRGGAPSLSLNTQPATSAAVGTPVERTPAGPPPGILDVNSIDWQYLDPQGQIQGPFPSATMQKWYDDGYFAPNLLMRRVNIDKDWMSVRELLQLAGTTRVFLTLLLPAGVPPGFSRHDPLADGPPNGAFGSPYQPVPTRSLLESYHSGSIVPDSPSSYSAGRFSNESPDPPAFNGRAGGHLYNEPGSGHRLGFSNLQHETEPQRRATMDDTLDSPLSRPTFAATFSPNRANTIDGLGFALNAATNSAVDSTTPFTPNFHANAPDTGFSSEPGVGMRGNTLGSSSYPSNEYMGAGFMNAHEGPRLLNRDIFGERTESQSSLAGQFATGAGLAFEQTNQFAAGQPIPYAAQTDTRSASSIQELQSVTSPIEVRNQQMFSIASQSPWRPQEPQVRLPGPFDPDYPTNRNTVVHKNITPTLPIISQPRPPTNAVQSGQSPWIYQAAQGIVNEAWGADTNSLTAANLGQHNRQHEQEELQHKVQHAQSIVVSGSQAPVEQAPPEHVSTAEIRAEPTQAGTEAQQPAQKHRRGPTVPVPPIAIATTLPVQVAPTKPIASPVVTAAKPPSPTQLLETKHAWSFDEGHNGKPANTAYSLREIQEIEAKKQEVRKAAERERERVARVAATSSPASSEEPQIITWGLPTSQVGARSTPVAKEPAVLSPPSATSPNAPVWTGAPKAPAAKKTMKEIQEEEEKRKKMVAKEKETVANAARRAYAETTHKVVSPVQAGGAWTTVGSGGKTNSTTAAAVAAVPVRPTLPSVVSVKAVPTVSTPPPASVASIAARNGSTAPSRPSTIPAAIKLVPAPKDDTPAPPSHDFLKWMAECLKGLNSSVNIEEISSMLLSFPLDPDPSTLELISDLIYASSTTLDGRRFASEFVSKRKLDSKGSVATAALKPLSIADVVKTQPKPAQNEWGGFKAVNKKKKGSRA